MNGEEARFMQLKRLSQEEVQKLHDLERAAGLRWREAAAKGTLEAWESRGEGWRSVGSAYLARLARVQPAFWDPRMPETERARVVAAFMEHPSVRRAFKMLDDREKTEFAAQHLADWLVWREAPMVGTRPVNPEAAASFNL